VTSRILIIHTQSQLEEASGLVDLLEASLSLPEDAIVCSSLPGYATSSRSGVGLGAKEFATLLHELGAALALVDEPALNDAQLWFDAAAVWSRGKRLAVLVDSADRTAHLPSQLASAPVVVRTQRSAIVGLIEDLAFDLGVSPRLGRDAQRALDQLSTIPPPATGTAPALRGGGSSSETAPALRGGASSSGIAPALRGGASSTPSERVTFQPHQSTAEAAGAADSYEAIDTVPPPPFVPHDARAAQLEEDFDDDGEEPFELDESDVEPVRSDYTPRHSRVEALLTCSVSLNAGRAIGECSFHRDGGGDFVAELEGPFGAFVDAAGGNWEELKRLGDVDVWLAATDNLLESLPPARRDTCQWYEIGFQFSTLRSIAEQGLPDDLEQRASYQEMWSQAMAQLRTSMASAGVAPREIRRLQALLENLIGPEAKRDYGNIGRALAALGEHAAAADRGELQMAGRAAG
jgi:hypothetical protein